MRRLDDHDLHTRLEPWRPQTAYHAEQGLKIAHTPAMIRFTATVHMRARLPCCRLTGNTRIRLTPS